MSDKMPVAVPTVKGIGGAFKDFGIGLIGGLVFLLAYQLFGALGVIAAPLLAGSMIKGDKGTIIATMSGFMLLALGVGTASNSNGGSNEDRM